LYFFAAWRLCAKIEFAVSDGAPYNESRFEMKASKQNISAAIFDVGMVLLKFDFAVSVKKMTGRCSVPADKMLQTLWASGLVKLYETGKIETGDFSHKAAVLLGFDGSDQEFMDAWTDIFTPNDPMIERARRWKKSGMPLYLISNTCEAHIEHFKSRYEVFNIFDGEIYSCREGCAKPEVIIYERALERYELDPERTVFIDDLLENVNGARSTRMQAIHYQGEDRLLVDLQSFDLD
jgi:glucose-1-phosphatase